MSIFSKIIAGEIPSYKIAETEKCYAFLDISPLVKGHVLVVPKIEVDKIFDLEDDYLTDAILLSKKIGKAIERAFDCKRCGVTVIGLEVPHAHIHLMPISKPGDMNFSNATLTLSDAEMKEVQQKIVAEL